VPVLRFVDTIGACAVDLSVKHMLVAHYGASSAPLQTPAEPSLQPYTTVCGFESLVMLLKLMLRQCGLADARVGGLGSFKLGVLIGEHLRSMPVVHTELGAQVRCDRTPL
jgi:hypothetical protein